MHVRKHPNSRLCEGRKPDGSHCQARPIASAAYCFFHDPQSDAQRELAQRTGGLRNKTVVLPSTTPDARLRDARDVAKLLAETINQLRRGELDPRVANAMGYQTGLLMKAFQETEIDKRLAALEAAVKLQPVTPEFSLDEDHSARGGENGYK